MAAGGPPVIVLIISYQAAAKEPFARSYEGRTPSGSPRRRRWSHSIVNRLDYPLIGRNIRSKWAAAAF